MSDLETVTANVTEEEIKVMTRCTVLELTGATVLSYVLANKLTKQCITAMPEAGLFNVLKSRPGLFALAPALGAAFMVSKAYNKKVCVPRILAMPPGNSELQSVLQRSRNGEKLNIQMKYPGVEYPGQDVAVEEEEEGYTLPYMRGDPAQMLRKIEEEEDVVVSEEESVEIESLSELPAKVVRRNKYGDEIME